MTRRMLNHQSLLTMILGVLMMVVMNLLKCSDGGDGDDYDGDEST